MAPKLSERSIIERLEDDWQLDPFTFVIEIEEADNTYYAEYIILEKVDG